MPICACSMLCLQLRLVIIVPSNYVFEITKYRKRKLSGFSPLLLYFLFDSFIG
ncbi:hypothetical protein RchiOBHm_Chr4g0413821 [Rosa chinensis]|uniref:Uncharacterized protein n=1 Tax=Rosa chinensis TaxID=74649 RepID=A0A2P6QWB5_ROSCH|nr:hypothetical protein RchiOBHm_Chr4g0413821 [Rosa chinensis]